MFSLRFSLIRAAFEMVDPKVLIVVCLLIKAAVAEDFKKWDFPNGPDALPDCICKCKTNVVKQENFGKRGKRSPQFGPGFGNFNGPTKRPRPTLPPLTAEELLPGFPLYNEDFVSRPEFANQIFPFITPVIATTTTSTTSSSSTTTTTTTKIKIPNVNEPSSTSSPLSQKKIESTSHKVETSTSTSTSVPFTSLPQNRIVESSKTETKAANANIGLRQETGTTAATTATTTTATTTTSSTSITKSTILTVKEIENPKVFETITKGETEEEAVDVRAISVAEIKDDLTPLQMVDEVNLSKENVTSETNAQIVDTQPVIKTDTSKETPIKNVSPPKKNNFTIQSLIEPASLIPHPTRTIEVQTKPSQGSSDPQFLQSQPSTFFPIHRQGQTTNSHQNPRLPMSPQTVSYSGSSPYGLSSQPFFYQRYKLTPVQFNFRQF